MAKITVRLGLFGLYAREIKLSGDDVYAMKTSLGEILIAANGEVLLPQIFSVAITFGYSRETLLESHWGHHIFSCRFSTEYVKLSEGFTLRIDMDNIDYEGKRYNDESVLVMMSWD